jgi:hypothetical protein
MSTQVAKYFREFDVPFATEMKLEFMLHFTRSFALYIKASVKIKNQPLLL